MRGISYILSRVWLDIRFLRDGENQLTIREIGDGKMAAGIRCRSARPERMWMTMECMASCGSDSGVDFTWK